MLSDLVHAFIAAVVFVFDEQNERFCRTFFKPRTQIAPLSRAAECTSQSSVLVSFHDGKGVEFAFGGQHDFFFESGRVEDQLCACGQAFVRPLGRVLAFANGFEFFAAFGRQNRVVRNVIAFVAERHDKARRFGSVRHFGMCPVQVNSDVDALKVFNFKAAFVDVGKFVE